MRVHHLNCISSCPLGGHLMDAGHESVLERAHLTNHCLLIEDKEGLVLIDTGFGLRDVHEPHSRLSEFFLKLLAPEFREELTAVRQIESLGYDVKDVRNIVLTHLDFDHAGGLDDFPEAKVHMLRSEKESAVAQSTWLDRQRYRPQQWNYQNNWITYEAGEGDTWFGFSKVQALQGVSEDIALIPLIGHSLGHCGVAVFNGERWLLDAGDAYFYHDEMRFDNPYCTPGLKSYQLMMDKDHTARVWNQDRLRQCAQDHFMDVKVFCSHDTVEFEMLAGHSAGVSAHHNRKHASSPRYTDSP
ncbi:MBL fold metallo-hydrolase [Bdellovibrio bacteriovorus]